MNATAPERNGTTHGSGFNFVASEASGRWAQIIPALSPIPAELLDGKNHPCPVCGGKDRFCAFSDFIEKGTVFCRGCRAEKPGDGFDTLCWINGWDSKECLNRVAEYLGIENRKHSHKSETRSQSTGKAKSKPSTTEILTPAEMTKRRNAIVALQTDWQKAIQGSPILDAYLASRGLMLPTPSTLRLDPMRRYWVCEEKRFIENFPAMLAQVRRPTGTIVALHQTWLELDGSGKLLAHNAKKVTGEIYKGYLTGVAIRLYPAGARLCITEGIETALAIREVTGLPVWAAYCAGAMKKIEIPPTVQEVIICADWNLNGIGQQAANDLAERLLLDGFAVRVVIPPPPEPGSNDGDDAPVDAVDWLDVLNNDGPEAIKAVIDAAEVRKHAEDFESAGKEGSGDTTKPTRKPSLSPGIAVMAHDRTPANYGTVVEDKGETVVVHFDDGAGNTQVIEIAIEQLTYTDGKPIEGSGREVYDIVSISSSEFLAADYNCRYLIDDVLVEGQNCIIGGRSKTLKTSTALDMAISLSTATPFFGIYRVPEKVPVGFITGESGPFTIRETAKRIARQRSVLLSETPIRWSFDLPKLCRPEHLDAVERFVAQFSLKVVFVDPLYLALLDSATAGNAGNVYVMGQYLEPLTKLSHRTGVTIILLHHFKKGAGQEDPYGPPDLEDLSQAGVVEWCRQWVLLKRIVEYQSDGVHRLSMRTGGSVGHAGTWSLTIDEGTIHDPDGRRWEVEVLPADQAKEVAKERRESEKETKARQAVAKALVAVGTAGGTMNDLAELAGLIGRQKKLVGPIVGELLKAGTIEKLEITKGNRQKYDAYRLKV